MAVTYVAFRVLRQVVGFVIPPSEHSHKVEIRPVLASYGERLLIFCITDVNELLCWNLLIASTLP